MNLTNIKKIISAHKKISVGAFVLIAIVFIIFNPFKSKKNKITYQTTEATKETIVSSVSASGEVLTANIINITTQAKGLVSNIYVKEGDKISAGQKLFEFNLNPDSKSQSASAYSSYLSAKNNVDSAQATLYSLQSAMFTANQKLINDAVARDLTTDDPTYIEENADWLAAEAKYKNQLAVINQARAALNSAWLSYQSQSPIVYAPMGGTISNITIAKGLSLDSSTTSQRVAVIKSGGLPMATFDLSEIDVSRVKPGQKVTLKLDAISDKSFTGTVLNVDRIGTITSNVTNYPVMVEFDTDSPEILPNMAATANIIVDTKVNVVAVPSSAVIQQNGQTVVRLLVNNQERTVNVETGISSDTLTEIISGVSEGNTVITGTSSASTNTTGTSIFSSTGRGGISGAGAGRLLGR